jgi:predicted alpha/beta hydrolase family esterase
MRGGFEWRRSERTMRRNGRPAALGPENAPVTTSVLIVPGLRGGGPAHWQSLWLAQHPEYRRVLQHDWLAPRLEDWAAAIDAAIGAAGARVFVVAHGFGCLATLARLARRRAEVAGALLVAPRDPAEFGLAPDALDTPATLVASRNDPWMAFANARRLARRLRCRFVDAGEAGHIDAAAGYGPWPEGERLLAGLVAAAAARERDLETALALAAAS